MNSTTIIGNFKIDLLLKGLLIIFTTANIICINSVFASTPTPRTTTTTTTAANATTQNLFLDGTLPESLYDDMPSLEDIDDDENSNGFLFLPNPSNSVASIAGISGGGLSSGSSTISPPRRMFSSSNSSSSSSSSENTAMQLSDDEDKDVLTRGFEETLKDPHVRELRVAIDNGHIEKARELITNFSDVTNFHVFMIAVTNGDEATIKILLEKNPPFISFMLGWAAENGHKEIVEMLLAGNPSNVHITSALWVAAKNGYKEIVEMLLAKNPSNANFVSALEYAAKYGHIKIIEVLLEKKPDTNAIPGALWNAAENGHKEIVEMLLAENPSNVHIESALWNAAKNGHIKIVEMLLTKNPSIQSIEVALECAIKNGHIDIVKILLRSGEFSTETLIRILNLLLELLPKQGLLGQYTGEVTEIDFPETRPMLLQINEDEITANTRLLIQVIKELITILKGKISDSEISNLISDKLIQLGQRISKETHDKLIDMIRPKQQLPRSIK